MRLLVSGDGKAVGMTSFFCVLPATMTALKLPAEAGGCFYADPPKNKLAPAKIMNLLEHRRQLVENPNAYVEDLPRLAGTVVGHLKRCGFEKNHTQKRRRPC